MALIAMVTIASVLCMSAAIYSATAEKTEPTSLKVLAIGNSFSDDALQYLYRIAADCGVQEIVVANLYIGGCTLKTHIAKARSDAADYTYRENSTGTWKSEDKCTMAKGIAKHDWDLISLQQASGSSGMADTYNEDLTDLIAYVRQQPNGKDARLVWHMTWAYQGDSDHGEFSKYGKDQMTMYRQICEAVQQKVVPTGAFEMVIPSGTAIQNLRTSFFGDTLTRDGYHLTLDIGRFTAGLTWAHALGLPLSRVHTMPDGVPSEYLLVLRDAVEKALATPYDVTASAYPTKETLYDLSAYTEMPWEAVGSAYWNSSLDATLHTRENSSEADLDAFAASARRFTRAELPVGSLLVVDSGYRYRAEGWRAGDPRNAVGIRPVPTEAMYGLIDEAWWGEFETRAFNISAIDGSPVSAEDATAHFHIYLPKN